MCRNKDKIDAIFLGMVNKVFGDSSNHDHHTIRRLPSVQPVAAVLCLAKGKKLRL